MSKRVPEEQKQTPLEKAFANSKRYTAGEAIQVLRKHYRCRFLFAIFHVDGEYIVTREKNGIFLYNYAMENGHEDYRFLGFYGGATGWECLMDDLTGSVAA